MRHENGTWNDIMILALLRDETKGTTARKETLTWCEDVGDQGEREEGRYPHPQGEVARNEGGRWAETRSPVHRAAQADHLVCEQPISGPT